MLLLNTAAGERLEIPAGCVIVVMRPCNGINPSAIMYDMGEGAIVDQLSNPYGVVKKTVLDAGGIINPIEVKLLEPVLGDTGDEASTTLAQGRMIFARSRIVGRREVLEDPNGVRSRLFVDLAGNPIRINVADTLDELDGVEAGDPVDANIPIPLPSEGA
ncbi:MAG: hypothetical protein DI555_06610 [Novosphingobium pentaromativorans]|uniref:Uncharacterized protein n=1 Tax=Novosphingobium pentaromativorans TaxID=205844 RepID=A0A2W5QXZ7_9SPHN|nr:MAG: hypothetical protein DI555_06610 [Novosphingobium pentaromativorans]